MFCNMTMFFFQPHILHLAPPVVSFLANNEDVKFEHLTSIRRIFVAAAPFGETLANKFLEKAPHVIFREGKILPTFLIISNIKMEVGFIDL